MCNICIALYYPSMHLTTAESQGPHCVHHQWCYAGDRLHNHPDSDHALDHGTIWTSNRGAMVASE